MLKIEHIKKLDETLEKLIDDEFEKQSSQENVSCNYTPFNFIAKESDEAIGFLTGYTCYGEIYINELIVVERYRGKGIGMRLMKQVADHYKDKGFNNINLVTNAFQAPEFYKKCGFELEFVRENKDNPKLTKYFFVKYF